MAEWILLAATGGLAALATYVFFGVYWQDWIDRGDDE